MKKLEECKRIIRQHYRLNRPVTEEEVRAEVENIKRRGRGDLDYLLENLAARLGVFD